MEVRSVLCFFALLQVSLSERGQRPFQSLKAPRETITNYDVISPVIGYRSGQEPHPKELWVFLATPSGNFTLQLELNDQLLHPNFGSTYYDKNGNEIVEKGRVNCFYHGRVKGHPEWMLSMSTCHGLQGSFGDIFHLEPLSEVDSSLEQPHAFYLASEYSQEEGGCACNETVHPHSPLPPPGMDAAAIKRRLRRQVNGFLVTELVIVSDFRQYDAHGRNVTATVQRALEVANYIDRLYRVLKIRIVLVGTVTWSNGDQIPIVTDFVQLLDNFMPYQPQISTPYDSALLFTGVDLDGSTIGYAFVGTMCSDLNSIGLVQDTRRSVASTGGITAHELGHIFNMNHDDGRSCSCANGAGGCIMSASLPFPPPTNWSSCSVSDLNNGFDRGLDRCLTNEPTVTVGDPVCGNGIREGDEVCDCGSSEFGLNCTDPCCNARTCKLADGAQCHRGSCCQPNCQFSPYGTTCRRATNECDILEYCTGASSDCPRDVHLQDGSNCDNRQSLCFSGVCQSFDSQCQLHYGSASRMAVQECYSVYNVRGTGSGNCGSTSTAFVPCDQSNILCGQLQCTPGQYTNVAQVRVTIFQASVRLVDGSREDCNSFTAAAGSDTPSPGLVQDGSKCGDQRLCFEQRCTAVSDLNYIQPCSVGDNGLVCAGNGLCNNLNLCSCTVGFGGTACQTNVDNSGRALCPDPPAIRNGRRTFTGNSVGNTATYTCNGGFELIGIATATCTAAADGNSAVYSPVPPPECRPLCPDPPAIMNGMRTFTGNSVGDTATYTCDPGLELIGIATVACTAAVDGNSAIYPAVPPPECRQPNQGGNNGNNQGVNNGNSQSGNSTSDQTSSGGGNVAAIAGAVVGVLLGLGLVIAVVVVVVVIVRKRRTKYHPPIWRTSKPVAKTTAVSSRLTPRPPPVRTSAGEQVDNRHYFPSSVVVKSGYDRQSNGTNGAPSGPPPSSPTALKPRTVENIHFHEPTAHSTRTTQPADFGDSPKRRPPPKPPTPTTHLPTGLPPTYPPPARSAAEKKQATQAAQPNHASPGHQQSKPHPLPPSKRPPPPKPVLPVKPPMQQATPEKQETRNLPERTISPKPKQHRPPPSMKPPTRPADTKPEVPSSKPAVPIKPVIMAKQVTEATQPDHASPGHQQSKPHPLPPSKRPPPPKPVLPVKPSLQQSTPENQETRNRPEQAISPKPKQRPPPPSMKPPPRPEDAKPKVPSSKPTASIKPVKPAAPTLPRPQPSRDLQQDSAPAPPTKPKPAVPAKKPLLPPRK